MSQLQRARNIRNNLGRKALRGYQRNNQWSLTAKLYLLIFR